MSTIDPMKNDISPLSGAGLLFVASRITDPHISHTTYNKYYSNFHVPDVIKSGVVSHAARWDRTDESNPDPYLALYRLEDLKLVNSEKFKSIPMTHELLGGQHIHEVANLDSRFYKLVEVFEKTKHDEGYSISTHIIAAGMSPPSADSSVELDRWYREEHNEQMSLEPGWIRSSRYKLAYQFRSPNPGGDVRPDAPEWMTIHEFGEGNRLGTKVEPLDPITDWTKKVMGDMKFIEAYNWKNSGTFEA